MNTSYLLPFSYAYCEGENGGESGNSLKKIVKRKLECGNILLKIERIKSQN